MTSRILEYRNGLYQGEVKGNKRHGEGILITDSNTIIVSEWKNDVMSGKGLIFYNPDHYGYGEFNRGEIEGPFLFRTKSKTLFCEFNLSRPINKMVLINHETEKVQTIIHKNPIFEVLSEKSLSENQDEQEEIERAIGIKFPCSSLLDFLYKEICKQGTKDFYETAKKQENSQQNQSNFKMKSLNNGNTIFFFEDQKSPSSVGFCLNKNQQLVSCGLYVNEKLSGLGCKYENAVRYEGIFENGFVHGIGLKFSQGKYSFGEFENGNLIEAIYIDDRSPASEQKLAEFKKVEHIRSIWYENSYIRPNIVKFKGVNELVFELDSQQEFMYPIANHILNSGRKSPVKGLNLNQTINSMLNDSQVKRTTNSSFNNGVNNSKNLGSEMFIKNEGLKLETKSSKDYNGRSNLMGAKGKNSFDSNEMNYDSLANSNVKNESFANSKNIADSLIKINQFTNPQKGYFKNPEDDEDIGGTSKQSNGLKNLRKFKY